MSNSFECICCRDRQHITRQVLVANTSVCLECFEYGIKQQFINSLQKETDHLVIYEGKVLNINDFATFFTPGFLAAYNKKQLEYATPTPDRVYCDFYNVTTKDVCGRFLGSKTSENVASIICNSCSTPDMPVRVCTKCCKNFLGEMESHTCGTMSDPYAGLTQGEHYQICPGAGCSTKIQLSEACNHITCKVCNTHFCYLCADVLFAESTVTTHFSDLGCPHYGLALTPVRRAELMEERRQRYEQRLVQWHNERLVTDHVAQLRWADLGPIFGEPFATDVGGLVILLWDGVEIYGLLQDPERFQDDEDRQWTHDRIVAVAGGLPPIVWTAMPALRHVLDTYLNAWEGRVDDAGRVVRG